MSFMLPCPNCGLRDVAEFRYGGEVVSQVAHEEVDREHMPPQFTNLPEVQRERWYHRFGCRRWLEVHRNVRTNQVIDTAWLTGDME